MRLQGFPSLILFILVLPLFSPVSALAQYQVIHTLSGDEGSVSFSGLVRGADNRLYGTASYGGGPDGAGTLFRTTTDGVLFEVVHRFHTTTPEGGINPTGLMRGRDKNLYGTTTYGGAINGVAVDDEDNPIGDGVVYRLNWNGESYAGITVLHTFDCSNGEGGDPWGALMEGPSGALYGMTIPSGEPDEDCASWSTIFKLNKDGSDFAVLARFDYLETGSHQFGPLAFGADGSIYGTLTDSANDAYQYGSIFKIAPDGNVTYPKVFSGADGARPQAGVVRGIDGAMYGTTLEGGEHGVGTIFRMDEAGGFTTLYSFEQGSLHWPESPLVVGGDGKLYGATPAGGTTTACDLDEEGIPYGCGGTFIFDPAPIGPGGVFVPHWLFDYVTTGTGSRGALGVGADRHLYGTQTIGGAFDQGTLFGLLDIEVVNRPPVPVVLAFPSPAEALSSEGATVSLNALGSSDTDFDDLTYSWTLPTEAGDVNEAADHTTVSATFPTGTWPVTLTVSDGTDSPSIEVSVTVRDTTPPVVGGVNVIAQATSAAGAPVSFVPTATDNVGVASFSCVPPSGATFPIGSTTVSCTATDAAGNTAQGSFVVMVVDTVGPVITVPANIVVQVSTAGGAVVTYQASAADLVDGVLPVTCTPASGSTFAAGVTTVKCDAVDSRGNASTRSFTLTVVAKLPKPPKALVVVLPGVLWPANHQMMTVHAFVLATSDGGLAPIVTLQSITSSEADKGVGKGDLAKDIQGASYGTDDRVFQLRAERFGKAIGRVYTVTYKVASALNPSVFTIAKGYVWVPYDIKSRAHDWANCNHSHGDGDDKDRGRDDRDGNNRNRNNRARDDRYWD